MRSPVGELLPRMHQIIDDSLTLLPSDHVLRSANFAIISALLFGAAHAITMGRPKPFAPDEKTVEAYGEDVTTVVVWCAYGLNVTAQSLALGIVTSSIYIRQQLTNTLPSVISQLVFLSENNVLSNLGIATTLLVACLVCLVCLGGFLSVPTYGLLSLMILPILAAMLVPSLYPAFLKSALRRPIPSKRAACVAAWRHVLCARD